jgi:hypothetical protein
VAGAQRSAPNLPSQSYGAPSASTKRARDDGASLFANHGSSITRKTGEGGIRTLDTLLGYGALAKRCFQPLSHLTKNRLREYREEFPIANISVMPVMSLEMQLSISKM